MDLFRRRKGKKPDSPTGKMKPQATEPSHELSDVEHKQMLTSSATKPNQETAAKETAAKETASKETLAKEAPAKEAPAKETPAKETPLEPTGSVEHHDHLNGLRWLGHEVEEIRDALVMASGKIMHVVADVLDNNMRWARFEKRATKEKEDDYLDDSLLPEDPEPDITNLPITIFNIVNYTFCPLVVVTPYAVRFLGLYLGGPLLVAVGCIVWMAMALLVRVARILKITSYQDVALTLGGPLAFYFGGITAFLHYIMLLAILNALLFSNLTKFILSLPLVSGYGDQEEKVRSIRLYVFFISLSCICVFSLIRQHVQLIKLNVISSTLMLYCLGVLLYNAIYKPDPYRSINRVVKWVSPRTVRGITMIIFVAAVLTCVDIQFLQSYPDFWNIARCCCVVFSMHRTCLLMYRALANNSIHRWNVVLMSSIGIITVLLLAFSYSGFIIFDQYTQGDIFENFCTHDTLYYCRFFFCVAILLMYPNTVHRARTVCRQFLKQRRSTLLFYLLTTFVISLGALLSLATPCVIVYTQLMGTSISTLFSLILPGLYYTKVTFRREMMLLSVASLFLLYFGIFIVFYGTMIIAINLESEMSLCSQGKDMYYCLQEESSGV